jgi:hypothetical protein
MTRLGKSYKPFDVIIWDQLISDFVNTKPTVAVLSMENLYSQSRVQAIVELFTYALVADDSVMYSMYIAQW